MADHANVIRGVPLFRELPEEDIRRIAAVCRPRDFRPEEVVFSEGAPGDEFFIVLEGAVDIWKDYDGPERGLLATCGPGESFGELALIDQDPRSATVVARDAVSALVIEREDFHRVVLASGHMALSVMQSLSAMIRARTDRFIHNLRERNRHLERAYARLKREIEDRRQAERRLHHQAFHDPLTELPNRALFLNRLQSVMDRCREKGKADFAVLYLDVDRFSVVNESLGHVAGDEALVKVADRLRRCVRRSETLARFGGDEFAVLMEGVARIEDTLRVARRIRDELASPIGLSGREIFLTASVGIVPGRDIYRTTVEVLRDADIAMYAAKARGLGEYLVYDESLHDDTVSLLQLETDLRGAVARGEFSLAYQPIVRLSDGRVVGFETLARWEHPERGPVSPETFVPIAERTGTIVPLGEWLLREACRRLRDWLDRHPDAPRRYLNVNISGKQFMQPDFLTVFRRAAGDSGLPGSLLRVELTESVLIENVDHMADTLSGLKAMGVRIAIDDFGTGYSSLSYLHRFPIDVIKIDRSFVVRMGSREKRDLVAVIVSIAHGMNMTVVAEGVETEEQLATLREYGCEYGQGFLFSEPLTPEAAETLIRGVGEETPWPRLFPA
ncbi:MAG: putative bifunctional diguanylate cyclase/phosphodiesterase [Desulfococcaceae bacterium]